MNTRALFLVAALAAVILAPGCATEPRSEAGFRLPAGDPEQGRAAFVALQCHHCHSVIGAGLSSPVAEPPVGVDLGGIVATRRTDGQLVTSIIHPDHRISMRFAGGTMASGGHTRMGDYTETMTVRELADIVAFIQSRYRTVPQADL